MTVGVRGCRPRLEADLARRIASLCCSGLGDGAREEYADRVVEARARPGDGASRWAEAWLLRKPGPVLAEEDAGALRKREMPLDGMEGV